MPRLLFTPKKDLLPIVQEAGWAPGPVWTVRKILSPPEFDPRTVQPVVSRYTDYTTRPTSYTLVKVIYMQISHFCTSINPNCQLNFIDVYLWKFCFPSWHRFAAVDNSGKSSGKFISDPNGHFFFERKNSQKMYMWNAYVIDLNRYYLKHTCIVFKHVYI